MRTWKKIALILLGILSVLALIALSPSLAGRLLRQNVFSLLAGKGEARARRTFQERMKSLGRDPLQASPKLRIRKSERTVYWYDGETLLATFPVAFGKTPWIPAGIASDPTFPVGPFRVCYKKDRSRYHVFLGISYPSPREGAAALARGLITASQAEEIVRACDGVTRPPWNTPLGGPLGVHGFGADEDWTDGTLAMENGHIEEIFWNCPLGTPVSLEP